MRPHRLIRAKQPLCISQASRSILRGRVSRHAQSVLPSSADVRPLCPLHASSTAAVRAYLEAQAAAAAAMKGSASASTQTPRCPPTHLPCMSSRPISRRFRPTHPGSSAPHGRCQGRWPVRGKIVQPGDNQLRGVASCGAPATRVHP
jgi:hypothetical protein